jgi:hypothetical protein
MFIFQNGIYVLPLFFLLILVEDFLIYLFIILLYFGNQNVQTKIFILFFEKKIKFIVVVG